MCLYLETEGKNKGCWVMQRAGSDAVKQEADGSDSAEGPDEDAKVIVRSNGTVTYVGKDIAYHLWKFGLLRARILSMRGFMSIRRILAGFLLAGGDGGAAAYFWSCRLRFIT